MVGLDYRYCERHEGPNGFRYFSKFEENEEPTLANERAMDGHGWETNETILDLELEEEISN
jgi:hypothetical protein